MIVAPAHAVRFPEEILPHGRDPLDVVRAWPAERPLGVVRAGRRWTLLASGSASEGVLVPRARGGANSTGWMGFIAYEAGREIEPAAGAVPRREPVVRSLWQRCDGVLVHDGETGAWSVIGDADRVPALRPRRVRARAGALSMLDGRERYLSSVDRVVEAIRSGDIYQANLAHRLAAPFEGSSRALFVEMMRASDAWHGAYLEWDDGATRRAVVSASPELFLRVDGETGRVETRPMKGTAPASSASLEGSEKDRAELNMIVDLMRNDLGRVCRCGSVRVAEARRIERHGRGGGALHQGVATVVGELRAGLGLEALMRASFPGGSITGAPKIRAMQIIDELEGFERGPFCGGIGFVGDDGSATLSIGIRTATIEGMAGRDGLDSFAEGRLVYPVGAGIVVDSQPEAEWRETLSKAGVIREALSRLERLR